MHINRMMLAFCAMLLISINAFSADEIDKCASAVDHATMRKCLGDAVTLANKELTNAETKLMAYLRHWDQDQLWIDKAIEDFKGSTTAFRTYQKKQCDFEASTAAGGNSAGDLRLECIYRLAQERTKLILEQEKHLKN